MKAPLIVKVMNGQYLKLKSAYCGIHLILYSCFFAALGLSKMRKLMFLVWILLPHLAVVYGGVEFVGQAIKGK